MRQRVTERDVSALVERFYDRVRDDALLGPVFDAQVEAAAWPVHLARMKAFWSTVLLGTGKYRGDPITAHQAVPGIQRGHFERWLALFEEVAREVVAREVADAILRRAHRMGDRLTSSLRL